MKYKLGSYVKITLPDDDDEAPGVAPAMRTICERQTSKGVKLIGYAVDNTDYCYLELQPFGVSNTTYIWSVKWLSPCKIYKTGGNI